MQSEFTALEGVIHDLTNLKQEFEQTRTFKLIKYITKRAMLIQTESQKVVHEKRLKKYNLKINAKKVIFRSIQRSIQ